MQAQWYLLLGGVELLSGAADGALPLLPQCLHISLQLAELSCTHKNTNTKRGEEENKADYVTHRYAVSFLSVCVCVY